MHLQNGSVLCICSSACNLSVVSGFSVVLGVCVTSNVTSSDCDHRVGSSVILCWEVLLLVWNVGMWVHQGELQIASELWLTCPVAALPVWRGNLVLCFRLLISFWRLCYMLLVLIPICLLCCWYFFSIEKSCQWFVVIMYNNFSSLEVIVLFCDCLIYTVSFLLCNVSFPLYAHWGMWKKSYWEFHSIMFLWELCSKCIIRCIYVYYVSFCWIWIA